MKKRKKFNYRLLFMIMTLLLLLIGNIYFIYSLLCLVGIETLIRIVIIFILILLLICFILRYLRNYYLRKKKFNINTILLIIYSVILILVGFFIQSALNTLSNLTSDKTTYSVSLVTLTDNSDDIKNITEKVGILTSTSNTTENQIAKEIASENKINNLEEYDDYVTLINALKSGEVEYIFLPSNYVFKFQNIESLDIDLKEETKIIYTKTKDIENKSSNKTLTEPFTILLMGVDSEAEDISNATFNGDALMLITFNPKTLSTTILSIPRDSYVPIACFPGQKRNKITHAAWYGETCMMDTIENLFDIEIDYYVKVNFKGVVKLVDTLGGVEIDVPYAFCEQNSNRQWGENTIYVEEGLQTLNGEQALAYSRNRHPNPEYCSSKWTNYESNDFVRGQHQQEVLKAILNKLKSISDLNTVYNLIDTISNNLETNMSQAEILSLYNVGKDILTKSTGNVDELIGMQRLYLSGIDAYIYDTSFGSSLYDYVLYEESVEEVMNAMKENLNIKEKEIIKSFSFDSEEEYEEHVIGKGKYSKLPDYQTVPNFIGDSEYQSGISARKLGLKVSYVYDTEVDGIVGTVVNQNYSPGTLVSKVSTLVLTIKQEKKEIVKEDSEDNDEEKDDSKEQSNEDVELDDLLPEEE